MKKWMDKIKKNDKGFTLVELIVVIAVLAIITIVAAPAYVKYVEKARIGTDENAIGEIAHIAEVEYVALEAKGAFAFRTGADGYVDRSVKIDVKFGQQGANYTVQRNGNNDENSRALATAVSQMIGEYAGKSKTYAGKTITITVDGSGNATWNKEAYTN